MLMLIYLKGEDKMNLAKKQLFYNIKSMYKNVSLLSIFLLILISGLFIWLGFIFGPPAGIIMALPAEVLHPQNRAAGMGLFYSCFYGGMMALTSLAGFSRDLTQNAATPILFSGMLLIIAIIILAIFRTSQARIKLMPVE